MAATHAISFGVKNAWLAVASDDPRRVIASLGIRDAPSTGWPEGITSAYEYPGRKVFITPSIKGWVLVVGSAVSELEIEEIVELSKMLGTEVLRFSTHRVVGHDAWVRADRGTLVRAYEYTDGAIVTDRGELSLDEVEHGIGDGPPEEEVTVFALAEDWSVDPSTFDERGDVGLGWGGLLP